MAKFLNLVFVLVLAITVTASGNPLDSSNGDFDVRQHLGTSSRYMADKKASNLTDNAQRMIQSGCVPIHLNLVARHGTRAPTRKRAKELDKFSMKLEKLLKSVGHTTSAQGQRLIPQWLREWKSPWDIIRTAGHLTIEGEEELYHLGKRTRERFPELFVEDYHPDTYVISATQVPRASASAVAFGMGLFSNKGTLGEGRQRAFSVSSDSRAYDFHLRFHDTCQTYKEFKKAQKPDVLRMQQPVYNEISQSLLGRYNINFTKEDVASLWFLCKQEAALLDKVDQACGLFQPTEVELLEWADDLELHYLKGYGESLNYRMGVPLLQNVMQSMEQAISMQKDIHSSNIMEKARLRFAHAETVIPFSCLLGLFLSPSELENVKSENALDPPPKPPQQRTWRGSIVAPFSANIMVVLYRCPIELGDLKAKMTEEDNSEYFVEILHNEETISIPGCNGTNFCPFNVFKEKIAGPHLRYSFESLCTTKVKRCSLGCMAARIFKMLAARMFKMLFPREGSGVHEDPEL